MADKRPRLSPIIIGITLVAFGVAFVYALVEGTPQLVISKLLPTWRFLRAATLLSSGILPVLFAAAAAAVTFVGIPARPTGMLRPVFVPALVVCAMVSAYQLLVAPELLRGLREAESTSRYFRDSLKRAEAAADVREFDTALDALAICKRIDPYDHGYWRINDKVQIAITKKREAEAATLSDPAPGHSEVKTDDSVTWYRQALAAERAKEYFGALSAIDAAIGLAPNDSFYKLKRREIVEAMKNAPPSKEDAERAAIYDRKLQGYQALRDNDALRAYAIFKELEPLVKDDADVRRYLAESLERLRTTAVFMHEIVNALTYGGNAFAVVKTDGRRVDVVTARRAVDVVDATYFEAFEYALYVDGLPKVQVFSDYARLRGTTAIVRAVDREQPNIVHDPEYTVGAGPVQSIVELPIDHETANRILTLRRSPDAVPLTTLFSGFDDVERFGIDPAPFRKEAADRLAFPFGALIAVLLGSAFGARFRRSEPPSGLGAVVGTVLIAVSAAIMFPVFGEAGYRVAVALYNLLPATGAWMAWIGFLSACSVLSLFAAGRALSHVI